MPCSLQFWSAVADIVGAVVTLFALLLDIVGALMTLFALLLVAHQLQLQRQESRKAALAKLLSVTEVIEFNNHLTWVLQQEPEELQRDRVSAKHKKKANKLVGYLFVLAARVKAGLIPKEMVFRMDGPRMLKAAEVLRVFINDRRQKPGHEDWVSDIDWLMEEFKGMKQEEADAG